VYSVVEPPLVSWQMSPGTITSLPQVTSSVVVWPIPPSTKNPPRASRMTIPRIFFMSRNAIDLRNARAVAGR
jgi:hypothetical protein